jgi:dCMP deaminase|tara:strand:- start:3322 stop:3759 length:438 start_codon:yes stop_codon:yes gene_type:complete
MDKWQSAYMDTAERFASLSTAVRLQVGSIVVKDNRIISIGYNGMPAGWDNTCEDIIDDEVSFDTDSYKLKTKIEVIHAEANAIAKLAKSNESGNNSTMYITHAPCTECAKLIYTSGISTVYYKHKYRDENGVHFLQKCNIKVEQL